MYDVALFLRNYWTNHNQTWWMNSAIPIIGFEMLQLPRSASSQGQDLKITWNEFLWIVYHFLHTLDILRREKILLKFSWPQSTSRLLQMVIFLFKVIYWTNFYKAEMEIATNFYFLKMTDFRMSNFKNEHIIGIVMLRIVR